ncbi:hypothetical protein C7964_102374 [Loktanella sp. PT4BL]|uniref:hypothetical protein n=1 Tax=Loktanella sp. PT4BL TaxID=2135611 RepID=UPI000D8E9C34|nr:hypothetical protein [Loktanella sp. PT4BL]PXW70484.1 hypothetical protein C7964_102374 [Loktanella sp. PT4BL]
MNNANKSAREEFLALWELYKISKKNGRKNAAMLADMMASNAEFFMTKEIWQELISILREFDKFQDGENKTTTKRREEGWFFWHHYRNLRDGYGKTESKELIGAQFGVSFDRVHKVIERKYATVLIDREAEFNQLYNELNSK